MTTTLTTNSSVLTQSNGTSCQAARDEVAKLAYAAFQQDGSQHGHDLRNWFDAEVCVKARPAMDKHADHHAGSASSR